MVEDLQREQPANTPQEEPEDPSIRAQSALGKAVFGIKEKLPFVHVFFQSTPRTEPTDTCEIRLAVVPKQQAPKNEAPPLSFDRCRLPPDSTDMHALLSRWYREDANTVFSKVDITPGERQGAWQLRVIPHNGASVKDIKKAWRRLGERVVQSSCFPPLQGALHIQQTIAQRPDPLAHAVLVDMLGKDIRAAL